MIKTTKMTEMAKTEKQKEYKTITNEINLEQLENRTMDKMPSSDLSSHSIARQKSCPLPKSHPYLPVQIPYRYSEAAGQCGGL